MTTPASIRYNNPGAMWGGTVLAKKWGATANVALQDGLNQNNHIAVFPTMVQGAAAQFDEWHTSAHYHNKPLAEAIHTWSGGNSSGAYVTFLTQRVPGLTPTTLINDAFLSSPSGIAMMKAQAWNEAGRPYPMTDAEWAQAQALVFGGVVIGGSASSSVRIGDSGPAVSEMQNLLGCAMTGTYLAGSETEYSLRLFQVRNGLTPDGECGDLTWSKLK
jgi:hypothetical protein